MSNSALENGKQRIQNTSVKLANSPLENRKRRIQNTSGKLTKSPLENGKQRIQNVHKIFASLASLAKKVHIILNGFPQPVTQI